VYVLGPAERDPSAAPSVSDARLVIDPGERGWKETLLGDPFVVSDSGEEQAEWRQLKRGGILVGTGLLLAGFCALILFPSAFG